MYVLMVTKERERIGLRLHYDPVHTQKERSVFYVIKIQPMDPGREIERRPEEGSFIREERAGEALS